MAQLVYLNGNYCKPSEAKISIFDRAVQFADSVYEIIPVYKGRLFGLAQHLKRLAASLSSVKITPPSLDWSSLFNRLIEHNGGGDMQIYLQITRGNNGTRQHDIPAKIEPTVIAYTLHTPYPSLEAKKRGLHARLIDDIRWLRCDIKTNALLANVLLNDEAISLGADTTILLRNGFVTEGSASNIFLVDREGTVCTPLLNNLCLPGITRQLAIELIRSLPWTFQEKNIPSEALFTAQEIWITSTTKEIYPVTRVDGRVIGKGQGGSYWSQLNDNYQQLIKNHYE